MRRVAFFVNGMINVFDFRSHEDNFVANETRLMKTASLWLIALIGPISAFAQDSLTTGHIVYEEITDISDSRWVQNRPDMPTEIKSKWDVYFNPQNAHCSFHPEEEEDDFSTGGVQFRRMRWEPKDVYFLDFLNRRYQHYTDFMSKEFQVLDTLSMEGWKFTGKQGIVLGFPCMEVKKTEHDTVDIIAWFTPRLPVSAGPKEYVGFPGAVLYVNIDDGKTTISAVNVQMGKVPEEELEVPEDGEEVTRDEYKAIVEEKTREMRRRWGR